MEYFFFVLERRTGVISVYSYGLSPHFLCLSLSHHDYNYISSTLYLVASLVVYPTFVRTITSLSPHRTVKRLAEMIQESRVVNVRGTPASGKTTLACLLQEYYEPQGIPSVAIPVWPKPINPSDPNSYLTTLVGACHGEGYAHINRSTIRKSDIFFILDEGQMSY